MKLLSRVRLFMTPWTVAYQAPPSMGFSRQDTGVGCHFLLQETFPTRGSNPSLLYLLRHLGSPHRITGCFKKESSPWCRGTLNAV